MLCCCGKKDVPNLSTEMFNYTSEIMAKANELAEVSPLFDLDKETVLVSTKDFNITNKYAFPFIYGEVMQYTAELIQMFGAEQLEEHFKELARSRAMNEALYREAVAAGFDVSDDEVNARVNEAFEGDLSALTAELEKLPFTMDFIRKIRAAVPGLCLRTTLMVGFPGETNEDFAELLEFVHWARFERMGAFAYSEEEDTYSGKHYKDDVPQAVKDERLSRLMALQQEISEEMQAEMVGKTIKVIIDRREGDYYIGRSEFSSPEVDPEVLISAAERRLRRGQFYQVKITDSDEFDLYGVVE